MEPGAMHHYVYQIISLTPDENGVLKVYSGLRSCECLPEEDEYMGSGHAIKNAIAKYGKDKFLKIIVAKFDTREAAHECETNFLEKMFNFYGRNWQKFKKFHYNLRLNENDNGGNFHGPETRGKISAAMTGENNPNFGKQRSEETRAKISAANSGKQLSEETRDKISAAKTGENNPNFGKQLSEETRAKISAANSGKNNPMFGRTGENNPMFGRTGENNPMFGKTGERSANFKGLTIGTNKSNQTIVFCGGIDMRARGFNHGNISSVISGKRPHHQGFVFTRSTDPIFLQQLLDQDNFVDDVSKERIEQFLQQ